MLINNFYYPDGLPDPITRREVYLSVAAGANATLPDPITREEVYLKAIAEGGGGGSDLPPVTAADDGKVLGVDDGEWKAVAAPAPEDDRFVVTFTPTSPDYSGTMDKTPAELAAAYEAGKRIIAYAPAFSFRCELTLATIKSGGLYTFDFIALGEQNGQDIMLRLLTSDTASTYTVKIYPLATGQWTGGSY